MRTIGAVAALIGLVPFVWAAACVRASVPPQGNASSPTSSLSAAPSTARWGYHPREPKRLRARLDLGPSVRLFVGDAGERWLVDARKGQADAASTLADEDLIAVAQPSPGTFAFVGAGGTIYQSTEPLGPLTRLSRPDPPTWTTAAAGKLILGIRYDGTAVRSSDGGKSFVPVRDVPTRILDLDLAPDGRAMLLGSPESVWISRDGGATFARAPLEPVGAASVMLSADGSLVARGVSQSVIWGTEGEPVEQTVQYAITPPALDLLTDVDPGPSAAAISSGRAALIGGRYYEAVPPQADKGTWDLASSSLAGRTRRAPIQGSGDCRRILVSGGGRTIALVCTPRSAREESVLFPPLRLIVSRDAGSTFDAASTGIVADEEDTHITVTAKGTFLVTGACKPRERGLCVPGAPLRMVPSPSTKRLRFVTTEPSKLPPILGRTGHVRASPDGRTLYATATLLDDRRPAVLVSDDDGESFRAVPIDLPAAAVDAGAGAAGPTASALVALSSDALSIDEGGLVSIVAPTIAGQVWLVLDRQARLLSARILPERIARLAAVGLRGLAVSAEDGEVLESTDGGATFHRAGRLPKSESADDAPAPVACIDDGCLVGESFSRVGWGPTLGGTLEPSPAPEAPAPRSPTPIVCDVQDDVGGDLPDAAVDVDAFDGDRGNVAWSTYAVNRAKASVEVFHGMATPTQSVEKTTLLAPVTGDGSAIAWRTQAEGLAALRFRYERGPDGRLKAGASMRQVEVAWDHQLKGRVFHATIPDAGPFHDRDVTEVRKGEATTANIGLLSVGDDGIFVCPHETCESKAGVAATFLDDRGRQRRVLLPAYPRRGYDDRPLSTRSHVVRTGGQDVFLSEILERGGLMRARPSDRGAWAVSALSLLPVAAQANGYRGTLTWAFDGTDLAGLMFTASHAAQPGFAELLRLAAPSGVATVEQAPTQLDLGDPPRACSAADRKGSLRTLAPPQQGSRHPVIVRGPRGAVYVLHSDYVVTYGARGSPCASTFDTVPSAGSRANVSALVNAIDMDRSWLFMPAPSGGLRWRAMRCRYEPGAAVPEPHAPSPEPPPARSSGPASSAAPHTTPAPTAVASAVPPGIPSAVWTMLQSSGALSAFPPGLLPPGFLPPGVSAVPPPATAPRIPPPERPRPRRQP